MPLYSINLSPNSIHPHVSPDGDNLNPYRQARLSQKLSQADVAKRTGISRLSVLRLEQGLFAEPLGKVSLALGLDHSEIRDEYFAWQHTVRENLAPLPPVGNFDFLTWRIRNWPSQANFCTSLCVSQSTLHRFESAYPYAKLPGQIAEALLDAGLTEDDLDGLMGIRNATSA